MTGARTHTSLSCFLQWLGGVLQEPAAPWRAAKHHVSRGRRLGPFTGDLVTVRFPVPKYFFFFVKTMVYDTTWSLLPPLI
jgi:hypothetical protein